MAHFMLCDLQLNMKRKTKSPGDADKLGGGACGPRPPGLSTLSPGPTSGHVLKSPENQPLDLKRRPLCPGLGVMDGIGGPPTAPSLGRERVKGHGELTRGEGADSRVSPARHR